MNLAETARAATAPTVRWATGHLIPRTALDLAARRGDLQGRMMRDCRRGDPFPSFEAVRAAQGPLYVGRFATVATSLPAVREVLSSPDFRSGFGDPADDGPAGRLVRWAERTNVVGPFEPPSLLVTEPPDHTRYRRLLSRVFSARAVEALRERTTEIADRLLDDLDGSGAVDLMPTYCTLLPVTVIADILGVPTAERGRVLELGEAVAPSVDLGLSWRRFRDVEAALRSLDSWLDAHIARLRRDPGDDLLSRLVTAHDDGVALTDRELKATAGLILVAGFETTVNLLGNGVALLLENPDQGALLEHDATLWSNAVEEILRLDPPVLLTGRTAVRDTEIAGMPVARGTIVSAVLGAANRDPEVFADPDRFDVTRPNAREHLSFSAGRHHCLGAALSRMEGEVGLQRLFARYPQLERRPGARRRPTGILRGYEHLPVALGRAVPAAVGDAAGSARTTPVHTREG